MIRDKATEILSQEGLQAFQVLQAKAVNSVTDRIFSLQDGYYQNLGAAGRQLCREELAFHLEFLRPVLEFGILQSMVEYLHWYKSVMTARARPNNFLQQSLDFLAEYFIENMPQAEGHKVADALTAARDSFLADRVCSIQPKIHNQPWSEAEKFEAALLAGDQQAAHSILNRCFEQGKNLIDVELHIVQPALYQIGDKWQNNLVSVAQEHMATAIAQSLITLMLHNYEPLPAIDKKVLLACVEGNNHALGLQMVAHAFLLDGWEVQLLGSNVPTDALLQQVENWQPDLIGLSLSFPHHISTAKLIIAQLTCCYALQRPAVMIGGLAFNPLHNLVDVVGAEIYGGDSKMAVAAANQFINKD